MRGAISNGGQILEFRTARGLTQERLAALAGIDARTIRNAEKGCRLDLGSLMKLAFVLETDVSTLIVPTISPNALEVPRRDTVLRWNRAWDARDMDALLALYHDHAVVHLPGGPTIPFSGEAHGKAAIAEIHQIAWRHCDTAESRADEFTVFTNGDSVLLSSNKGLRLPGGRIEQPWWLQVFKFDAECGLIIDHRVAYDTIAMARWLGLLPEQNESRPQRPETRTNTSTSGEM
jgi:transcriptional regulator with XRE-family HTH domain